MHRAALLFFGLSGSYDAFDIEREHLVEGIAQLNADLIDGFNVTIPHKEAVFQLSEARSREVQIVGAVNTVKFDAERKMLTHNTDLGGFIRAFRHALFTQMEVELGAAQQIKEQNLDIYKIACDDMPVDNALVLGAGGAARACLAGLILQGCKRIVLAARRLPEANQVGEQLCKTISELVDIKANVEVLPFEKLASTEAFSYVVNCTPIGLTETELPSWAELTFARANEGAIFFDTVYDRSGAPTLLMQAASKHGLFAVDGLRMLAEQAALSFEFWTGQRPSTQLMIDAMRAHIRLLSDNPEL